jgi:hypothetical protein
MNWGDKRVGGYYCKTRGMILLVRRLFKARVNVAGEKGVVFLPMRWVEPTRIRVKKKL